MQLLPLELAVEVAVAGEGAQVEERGARGDTPNDANSREPGTLRNAALE